MSTQGYDGMTVQRRGPAFGERSAASVAEEKEPESRDPIDARTEAALGLAIVVPTAAGYAALAYGCYLAVTALF
jgi:hypothetical protein